MPHPTDTLLDDLRARRTSIAVIGLGYVGLPLPDQHRFLVDAARAWLPPSP